MGLKVRKLLASLLVLALPAVHAAGSIPIAVSPVSVKLAPNVEYASVEVSNRGDQATGIEIEVLRVKWVDGNEQYEATRDFVVSPPSFRLQAGKNRMVRFRYSGTHGDSEIFYRLFVRQLPEVGGSDAITMVFNLGVPVFIAPMTSQPALVLASAGGGGISELRNTGNVSLTVLQLQGSNCPDDARKVMLRVSPQQKITLKADLSRCATGAETDRGLIPLATP